MQADFRNVPFIGRYMTPTGQLVPRRRTRLQQKVHRHLCRQVGFRHCDYEKGNNKKF